MESRFNNFDEKQHENTITITNLPYKKEEKLLELVPAVINVLGIEIDTKDILFCKRDGPNFKVINGEEIERPQIVIVKFNLIDLKKDILQSFKEHGPISLKQVGYIIYFTRQKT